jgi:hypothetical protein
VTARHDVLAERGPGRPRPGGAGRLACARHFRSPTVNHCHVLTSGPKIAGDRL